MSIDEKAFKKAVKKARKEKIVEWDSISEKKKEKMKQRLQAGNVLGKIEIAFEMWNKGEIPSDKLISAIIEAILGK